MEKVAQWFDSFEEAENARYREYALMSPAERLRILFTLINPRPDDADAPRLERVAEFTKLERR